MYPLKTKVKYNPASLSTSGNIFTTVYLGNYISGDFRENVGSHLGVDIFPMVTHDNVVACLAGVVHVAEMKGANGNYVVIKHENVPDFNNMSNKTTYYSCYLHLTEFSVSKGDTVSEGQIIGKCGNTGNVTGSTGEHLHFQIDTKDALFHPYWPFSFKESSEAGLGFFEAVNKGLGLDNARKFSINPLVYLDMVASGGTISSNGSSNNTTANLSPTPIQASKYFIDVTDDADAIDYLYDVGVTRGYEDKTFGGENSITRAELLIMAYKFKKLQPTGNGTSFSDVTSLDWYYSYINSACSKGFVKGYEDGTFRPNNSVTRAEAIAIVLNIVIGKDNISVPSSSDYQDIQVTDWYCKYANFVSQNGLLDSIGQFFPNNEMKRRDLAVLLYNLRDRV